MTSTILLTKVRNNSDRSRILEIEPRSTYQMSRILNSNLRKVEKNRRVGQYDRWTLSIREKYGQIVCLPSKEFFKSYTFKIDVCYFIMYFITNAFVHTLYVLLSQI